MLRTIQRLEGYTVRATDGDVGLVRSFYFDAQDWVVRYIVVEIDEKIILLSPRAFGEPDHDEKVLPVMIDSQTIRNSPTWDSDRPVSRQHEVDIFNYYSWPYYWATPGMPGSLIGGLAAAANAEMMADVEAQRREANERHGDPDLHSTREVFGYHIRARDGEIGHLEDFVVEDDDWHIMYCIVDTSNWFGGQKVLVAPNWIEEISWVDKQVYVDLEQETIRTSPEYNPDQLIEREYEEALYRHYGREKHE